MKFRMIEVEADPEAIAILWPAFNQPAKANGATAPAALPPPLSLPELEPVRAKRGGALEKVASKVAARKNGAPETGEAHVTIADRIRGYCAEGPRTLDEITAHLIKQGVETERNLVNQHLYLLTRRGDLLRDEDRGVWRRK
jgi:hypothetical protein